MTTSPLTSKDLDALHDGFINDGFCVLRGHFPRPTLEGWLRAFTPLLEDHLRREGAATNRGAARHYVTLPFEGLFADPLFFDNDAILDLVFRIVGPDAVLCQLATDTPLRGSDFQDVHRDAPPLFPEAGIETPSFQLALNFPLVDVGLDNGPIEIARGTHVLSKEEGLKRIDAGGIRLEPITMELGDVMLRDVRGLHRGTPNRTDAPRPMVVIGYSRKWLFRPEVSIQVPRTVLASLSERARKLLRFNPVVESLGRPSEEIYQSFAY